MKKTARIYSWVILSIFLQVVILFYINDIFLVSKTTFKATSIDVVDDKPKENMDINIPDGATDLKVSFDGSYLAYFKNGNLELYDIKNKKEKKTISGDGNIISYYRWLPDRNMIIYAVAAPESQAGRVQIYTDEMDTDVVRDFPEIRRNLTRGSKIVAIELSPLTNVIYCKIATSDTKAVIYKFDVNRNVDFVMSALQGTLIKETAYVDNLIYQDSRNKINVRSGANANTTVLPLKNKGALLEVDAHDMVYAGELDNNGDVTKVYYGNLTSDFKDWSTVNLEKPVKPEEIYVSQNGIIFEVDESSNTLYDITHSKNIAYKGKMVTVLDDYIVSVDSGKLILDVIK
ncbi:MAG: hypothetical protein Q8920_00365 [Bacillota bacterium]|nr:hypothetical protein [Bacillota bacterium]